MQLVSLLNFEFQSSGEALVL